MSGYGDQVWDWLQPPLRNLRESCRAEPDLDWDPRFAAFLGELGLSLPDEHPVIASLAQQIALNASTNGERAAFVADDRFEVLVLDTVHAAAAAYDGAQPAAEGPSASEPGDPATVSEQAVLWFGLPALRDLATAEPDLLGRHGVTRVTAALASVVAYRLSGLALPDNDELTGALWTRVEGWLDGNPDVAARFYGVFGPQQVELADQWVTHQLGLVAGEIATLVPVVATAPVTEVPVVASTPVTEVPAVASAPAAEVPVATAPAAEVQVVAPVADPSALAQRYEVAALVEQALRDVPDAVEVLTREEIDAVVAEVLAESRS
jgi:hypothetical protein